MPQLDFTTYYSQLFWMFLGFTVLWAFLKYSILPSFQTIKSQRELNIAQDRRETELLEQQFISHNTLYCQQIASAKAEAEVIIKATLEEITARERYTLQKQEEQLKESIQKLHQSLLLEKEGIDDKVTLLVNKTIPVLFQGGLVPPSDSPKELGDASNNR